MPKDYGDIVALNERLCGLVAKHIAAQDGTDVFRKINWLVVAEGSCTAIVSDGNRNDIRVQLDFLGPTSPEPGSEIAT